MKNTETDKEALWAEYTKHPTQSLREKIIIAYAPLVKTVAGRLYMYLGNNVEFDDLVGYGIFGLIDAIDKFDYSKDIKFETYASLRIRGAILDQIRKMDWIPRTIRQKQRQIEEATKSVEKDTGSRASDEQIAEKLGISDEEYVSWQSQVNVTNLISLNEFMEAGSEPVSDSRHNATFIEPEEKVTKEELKEVLKDALEDLTEKEKKVIVLYYYEELSLKEISKVMEVSESRVSQLHTKALMKMRKTMGDYMYMLT